MTAAISLLAYAAALGLGGPRLLRGRGWAERSPRLGILIWQAASASVLGAIVLAGLALVVPIANAPHGLADLLAACQMMLQAHYGSGPQPIAAYAGILVSGGVVLWTFGHLVFASLTAARQRRRHREALRILARHRRDLGALVIDHAQPMAYCLPGRHRCVVVSSGALDRLNTEQLAAVLAHEHAHLHGRHDLALNISRALSRAFPAVPLFEAARDEITRLIELLADDMAARHHNRTTLAAALVTVATGQAPAAAMGAGGATALLRVRRLLAPHTPLSRVAQFTGGFGVALLLTLPITLAANPAIIAILERHCHLHF
ncbi:M56 family metallopeptidase [Actinomadura sp. SCN-SB]|uniref:M56 family metallopeptidase n=1 Tax=Actinomadura sp. SCN-SB TaxID=3373092 RepID=UPI0037509872